MKSFGSSTTYVNYGTMAGADNTKEKDDDSINGSQIVNEFMQRRSSTLNTIFGKIRHLDNIEKFEVVFLTIGIVSALTSLGFTIERLATLVNNSNDFTFALLLGVNILFCIYYIIRGVLQERPLEIVVFVISNFIVTIYVIINFSLLNQQTTLKLVRLVITVIFGSINILLGLKYIVKYLRSDNYVCRITFVPDLQRICRIFLWCEGLLIFDIQLQVSLLILVLKSGEHVSTTELVAIIFGVVFSLPWLIIGYFALRKENKILCYVYWGTSWLSAAFIIYKFSDHEKMNFDLLQSLYSVTFITCTIALVVRISLVISTIIAYRNFDKGYKELRYGTSAATANVGDTNHQSEMETAVA